MNKCLFRITNLYGIIASATFLVTSLLMAGVITYISYMSSNDVHFIDLAGKQRFFTIELVEEVILDHIKRSNSHHDHMKTPKIVNLINKLQANLVILQPAMTTNKMTEAFNKAVACFNDNFLPLLKMSKLNLKEDLHKLHEAGEKIVKKLDIVVSLMVNEQALHRKTAIFYITAFWALSLMLGIIMGILIYVKIRKSEHNLRSALNSATEFQRTIEEQNQELVTMSIEFEDAKNVALAANKTKSEFLANMSHELRTPLNSIIGFSEVMLAGMGGDLTEKHRGYATDINNSGNHLLNIINDILDLSKIEAGKTEVHPEIVEICSIFKSSISMIAERAQEKQIKVKLLTSCDGLSVYADPIRLKQVMLNLLSNSVKFTDDKGYIKIACRENDDKIIISIEDNGIGMDEEGIGAALTKFGQANNGLSRSHEGTGLGLPLCVELLHLMNGTIDVTSELGTGTMITLTLPKGKS